MHTWRGQIHRPAASSHKVKKKKYRNGTPVGAVPSGEENNREILLHKSNTAGHLQMLHQFQWPFTADLPSGLWCCSIINWDSTENIGKKIRRNCKHLQPFATLQLKSGGHFWLRIQSKK